MNAAHKLNIPKSKIVLLYGIPLVYLLLAVILMANVSMGIIQKSPPRTIEIATTDTLIEENPTSTSFALQSAQFFFEKNFVKDSGHIDLYISVDGNLSLEDHNTNSEAASYYLLWKAKAKDKIGFDNELEFITNHMLHPHTGHLMWRLDKTDLAVDDGPNIATDADLRAIRALLIAETQWGDEKYTRMIDTLAKGIETVGVTKDGYLAPYGGASSETSTWTANEVWISYADFTVFKELAERRGAPWIEMHDNMKDAALKAQLANGLYNSMIIKEGVFGNGIDGGGYSINSMWIMVRSAESNDPVLMQSARRSLQFYKEKFEMDAELYAQYDSNGNPLSSGDTPWAYALVGMAAVALDDREFSDSMMKKLISHQEIDTQSPFFGALPEGFGKGARVGQFTMQESILAMQSYLETY